MHAPGILTVNMSLFLAAVYAIIECSQCDNKTTFHFPCLHQVGPRTSVLGQKAREKGLAESIVTRLDKRYQKEKFKEAASKFQAVLLANHRCHASILCLPSSAFYDCNVVVSDTIML